MALLLPMAKDSTDGETNDAMRRVGGRRKGVFMCQCVLSFPGDALSHGTSRSLQQTTVTVSKSAERDCKMRELLRLSFNQSDALAQQRNISIAT